MPRLHLKLKPLFRDRQRCCSRSELARSAPRVAPNLESDPDVVRVQLEAREDVWEIAPGCRVRCATVNGSVPGPTLEGRVGQTLIVRVKNLLPQGLTLHWHGLRVTSHLDGTEVMQWGIPPGGSYEYRLGLERSGTFWYHPHAENAVDSKRGLYGAVIVRDRDEPSLDAEKVLLLDEVALERSGWLPGGLLRVTVPAAYPGDVRLVNGRSEPKLRMAAGTIERWRIVNASFGRCIRLSLGGVPFQLLGTDGGFLSVPVEAREILLAPGNRIDLAVGPFPEDAHVHLVGLPVSPGESPMNFATVHVGKARTSHAWIPRALKKIERLVPSGVEVAVNQTIRLTARALRNPRFFGAGGLQNHLEPVRVGSVQIWEVVNEAPSDQSFHLHGFFFQVLDVNGAEPPFTSWEDTYNVPAGGRVRIAWLPEDHPGSWLFHCHVVGSEEQGHPAHFDILRPDEEPRMLPHLY